MPGSFLRSVILPLAYSRVFRFPIKCIIWAQIVGMGWGQEDFVPVAWQAAQDTVPTPRGRGPTCGATGSCIGGPDSWGLLVAGWWETGQRERKGGGELERLSLGFPEITAGELLGSHLPNSSQS